MTKKLWFQVGVAILLTLIIIRMFMEVKTIFSPILIVGQTIFIPLLIGGVLFYLSRPLQKWLETVKFPRWASIISVFIAIGLLGWLFYALIGPALTKQANALAENGPEIILEVEEWTKYTLSQKDKLPESLQTTIEEATGKINTIAVTAGSFLIKFIQNVFQGVILTSVSTFLP